MTQAQRHYAIRSSEGGEHRSAFTVLTHPRAYARACVVELLLESFRGYARPGPLGVVWESVAIMQPWDFRLVDISIPVRLWHGEQDPIVRLASQEFADETIPESRPTIRPDAGHFGIAKHWR